jgi:hypothetical protein
MLPCCVTGLGAPLHRDGVSYGTICHVLAPSYVGVSLEKRT